ncbi:MAG: LysR substrate-binding domain-containing protein [Limnohabitans sp.]
MKLSQIQALVAIAETGSIRAAATRVGLTQPALSKSLQSLEEELSVSLVSRTSRGVNLTAYGKAVVTRGRGITQEVDRLREQIEQMRGDLQGTINLAVSPSPSVILLPQALARFRQDYPKVQLRIREAVFPDTLQLLREGLADIALGAHPQIKKSKQPEFLVERLYYNRLVVTGRVGHPKAGAVSLSELLDCDWLLHGPEEGPGSMYAPVFKAHQLLPPVPSILSQSFIATLTLLEGSDALSLLPERLIRKLIDDRRLIMLPIRELTPRLDVSMIVRANQPLTPVAQKLLQILRRTSPSNAELPEMV